MLYIFIRLKFNYVLFINFNYLGASRKFVSSPRKDDITKDFSPLKKSRDHLLGFEPPTFAFRSRDTSFHSTAGPEIYTISY